MAADESQAAAGLSHVDAAGRARMVDVGDKEITQRTAVAEGRIEMQAETLRLIESAQLKKGDVLVTAQLAGVMAAKRTHELIPLCHPLMLSHIDVELAPQTDPPRIEIRATVRCEGRTGVEMEALTAVSVAALTVYDMAKAVDRGMTDRRDPAAREARRALGRRQAALTRCRLVAGTRSKRRGRRSANAGERTTGGVCRGTAGGGAGGPLRQPARARARRLR